MVTYRLHLMLGQSMFRGDGNTRQWLADGGRPENDWEDPTLPDTRVWGAALQDYQVERSNLRDNGAATTGLPAENAWGPDFEFYRIVRSAEAGVVDVLLKITGDGTLRTLTGARDWSKTGADLYPDFMTAIQGIAAVGSAGDTFEVGSISLGFGYLEALGAGLDGTGETAPTVQFDADLTGFIVDLRADLTAQGFTDAATAPLLLWRLPAQSIADGAVDANIGNILRAKLNGVAGLDAAGRVVSADGLELRSDNLSLTARGTIEAGQRMAEAFSRAPAGTTSPGTIQALPLVFIGGQSNAAGVTLNSILTDAGNADSTLINGGVPYPNVWNWDWAQKKFVNYDPLVGANSTPNPEWSNSLQFGPEVTLVHELLKNVFPEGFAMAKLGVAASSIVDNGQDKPVWSRLTPGLTYTMGPSAGELRSIWPLLEEGVALMREDAVTSLRRQLDTQLIYWEQGESDAVAMNVGNYLANTRAHFVDLRALLGDDAEQGQVIPITIVKTRANPSGPFDQTNIAIIRDAQETLDGDPANYLVNVDDLPFHSDGVHFSGEASLRKGRRVVAALPSGFLRGHRDSTAIAAGGS
ncbi:MAG: sialate O-acetylesterase [Planctomycetota bacterium]